MPDFQWVLAASSITLPCQHCVQIKSGFTYLVNKRQISTTFDTEQKLLYSAADLKWVTLPTFQERVKICLKAKFVSKQNKVTQTEQKRVFSKLLGLLLVFQLDVLRRVLGDGLQQFPA